MRVSDQIIIRSIMYLTEALRQKEQLSQQIASLVDERETAARYYEHEEKLHRDFQDIDDELQTARKKYHDKNTKILKANATNTLLDDSMLIVDAIQQISWLREEIARLKGILKPQGRRRGFFTQNDDDPDVIFGFSPQNIRERIQTLNSELSDLDLRLQETNWKTEIE